MLWTSRQHAFWKLVSPFHSLAPCSWGSSALLRAQAGLEEAKRKVLREIGFCSNSWGLGGFLLWTGNKTLLHDIIPGKLHQWPLTKCSWCAHASHSVELHPVFTFELEKLRNTCLIMLVFGNKTWEIPSYHITSYHMLIYIYIRTYVYLLLVAKICLRQADRWRASNQMRSSRFQKTIRASQDSKGPLLPIQNLSARLGAVAIWKLQGNQRWIV